MCEGGVVLEKQIYCAMNFSSYSGIEGNPNPQSLTYTKFELKLLKKLKFPQSTLYKVNNQHPSSLYWHSIK